MAKLTVNQAEFEKQLKRILRLMKKAEKEGITFERPIIEKPQRITKQKIEEAKKITFAKIKELAQSRATTAEETPRGRAREPKDIYISHPRPKTKFYEPKPRTFTEAQRKAAIENIKKAQEARWKGHVKKVKPKLTPEERAEISRNNLKKAREAQKGKPRSVKQREAAQRNIEKARQAKEAKRAAQKQKDWKAAPSKEKTNGDYTPLPAPMTKDQANYTQVQHIIDLLQRKITPESAAAIEKVMEAVDALGPRQVLANFQKHPEANTYIDGVCFESEEEDRINGLKQLIEIIYDGDIPDEIDEFLGELDDYLDQGRFDFVDTPLKKYFVKHGGYGDNA